MSSKTQTDYPTQARISARTAAEPLLNALNNPPSDKMLMDAIVAQARHVELSGDEPLKDPKSGLIDSSEPTLDASDVTSPAQQRMAPPRFRAKLGTQPSEASAPPPPSQPQPTPSSRWAQPIGGDPVTQPQPKSFALRKFEQFHDKLVKLSKAFAEQINGMGRGLTMNAQGALSAPAATTAVSHKDLLIKMMTAALRSIGELQTSALQWLPPSKIDKLEAQSGLLLPALEQVIDAASQLGATDPNSSDLSPQLDLLRKHSLEFAALMVELGAPEPGSQHSPEMIEQASELICTTLEQCTDLADTITQWRQTGSSQSFESVTQTSAILSGDTPLVESASSQEPNANANVNPDSDSLSNPDVDANLDQANSDSTPENTPPSREGMSSNVTGGSTSVLPFATRVALGPDETDHLRYNDPVQAISLDPMPAEYPDDQSALPEEGESEGQGSDSDGDPDANNNEDIGEAGEAGDAGDVGEADVDANLDQANSDSAPENTPPSREGMSSNVTGGSTSVLPFATRVALGPDETDHLRYNDPVQAISLDPMPAEYPDDQSALPEEGASDGQGSDSDGDPDANENEDIGEAGDAGDVGEADFSGESNDSEKEKKRRRRRSRQAANSQGGLA